ncbi:DUF2644 domain-containing protein [Bacteroides pyogenes]|uniref:Uncharacterized protein n=2 Tax=Bacteroides pyogenes TaxID=310300 RepID=W4PDP5_9BACE|nr:DUF2644 domain-containing protein [Bacteroides pyogenes]MDY4249702.1 DUF2644 domain-containing protein [Bacteroides pyogenes]GAE14760.1 hypothetical protein JCM6292_938 [Bacteroides pyogenes JCM 6292]GAE17498.1 hypothetical protein JCM6294_254 [Bacteroides pyogenes DSM 20611 = JCM 6294]
MATQEGNQNTKGGRKKTTSFISFLIAVVVGLLAYVIITDGPDIVRGIIGVFSKK